MDTSTLDERLKRQNRLRAWRDCNDGRLPHRWIEDTAVDGSFRWWKCQRCPIRTVGPVRPKGWIGGR